MQEKLTRRRILQVAAAGVGTTLLGSGSRHVLANVETSGVTTPTAAQLRWQDCEMGVIYHLDMPVAAGDFTPNNHTRQTYAPKCYNPKKLDTDQWLAAAKAGDAKYAVFTATHFNGFMQWQSDLYPYSLKYAAWRDGKGDIVADFVESCHKVGILPGIYLSTHRNAYQTVWGHYVDWGKGRGTAKQAAYNAIAEKQVEELCSRYGDLVQIWFDAGVKTPAQSGPDVLPIFEKHQPNSVFYHSADRSDHRWIGNEAGHAGCPCFAAMPGLERGPVSPNSDVWKEYLYHGDPEGSVWSPAMVDIVLRGQGAHDWSWRPGFDNTQYSVEELLNIYDASVGRNCNLVIGLVVNNQGLVPQPDMERMADFGKTLRKRFSKSAGWTQGEGDVVALEFETPREIDQVVIQEDIAHGERVRRYVLEGRTAHDNWQELAEGQSIGNKHIERIKPVELAAVRLRVLEEKARPRIKNLQAFAPPA